ncbi:ATPase [Paenibacillus marchantiophytorum]|uniref:ATPase n=1 Tax=Paenibacillus marchantiophytorum TaxID=1619310 RepID=A0ABQ2BUP3_9BACL|nr:ATP-binding protein [Paenibacillus marchantiophytorum]GGI46266.1 ATPase [Paenibacillus marchantiophytorum]
MDLLSDEKILKVLLGYNPWWTTGIVPKEFTRPVKRLAFYEASKIYHHAQIRREVILSGPRRVGKTTIMYQMIEQELNMVPAKAILYVSFDHPILKLVDIGKIIEIFQNNMAYDQTALYLFFDEIQYASDWDLWLKTLYDSQPSYKIMATGSASPVLAAKATESGVGRWTFIRIPTLSFYEYIEIMGYQKPTLPQGIKPTGLNKLKQEDLSVLMLSLEPLQRHFHRYLLVGGFPEVALSDDIPFAQKIIREDVVDKVIKRDMASLFGIRNVAELEKIFLYLCMISGNIVVQDTIAKEVGVTRQTVANYMELLEQANLIYISKPIELKGKRILKAKSKVYLADAAIRNAVLMQGEEVLADSEEMGLIIETSVYKHVYSFYYTQRPEVGYFRDSTTQKEIDVIVSMPMGKIIIEVKYRENTSLSEKEAIMEWSRDERTKASLVITKNGDDYGLFSLGGLASIVKIPAFAFLYLLGHAEHEGYI